MNLRSRKVAVILSAAACAAIITCIVIFNGTAKTTTENSRSIAKETEETTESKNILADIEANRPILVGTKEDEIIESSQRKMRKQNRLNSLQRLRQQRHSRRQKHLHHTRTNSL